MGSKAPTKRDSKPASVLPPAPPLPHETMNQYRERTGFAPITFQCSPLVYHGRVGWIEAMNEAPMIGEGI
jgi:hypothetical protein